MMPMYERSGVRRDDYILKPFNYLTLLARVKQSCAGLKRAFAGKPEPEYKFQAEYRLCHSEVKVDNELVKLTPIEYQLLICW
jgi:DNA-binding response OmpR family regulator